MSDVADYYEEHPFLKEAIFQPPAETMNFEERIKLFTKALTYGVKIGLWSPEFIEQNRRIANAGDNSTFRLYVNLQWIKRDEEAPTMGYLKTWGYFERDANSYYPTPKAFALLDEPEKPPSIFISYKREASSAFCLLLISRLQARGVENPWADMRIDAGDAWHGELEEKVKNAEYFVLLIAPPTLSSKWVRKEVAWALETETTIIPIWHNGYKGEGKGEYPEIDGLFDKQAIEVESENMKQYNAAVIELLNRLGYAP
ncbi:MAG: toll/interleukin-1 receptor domain-containing protein [Chloroflexi bacterium]|nr:toll/interleukin-1 receptor domain-containing protein [Chloroflexota bacterium]